MLNCLRNGIEQFFGKMAEHTCLENTIARPSETYNLKKLSSYSIHSFVHSSIHSFTPLACAECNNSLQLSGASSTPVCYIPFPSTLFHQLFFHPPSLHLAICFLVCLSVLSFPNANIIFFFRNSFFFHSLYMLKPI